jgi:hypothetical protein
MTATPAPEPKTKQLETNILLDVVTRFVKFRKSTLRRSLLVKYEGQPVPQAIFRLIGGNLLQRKTSNAANEKDEYLPKAASFEFCGNGKLREQAKFATTVVFHTLKQMFKGELDKERFIFEDLNAHIDFIYPDQVIEDETVKLGLYLAKDFSVLQSYQMNSPDDTEVISFQIAECAVGMANPDAEWDTVMSRYLPREPDSLQELPPARRKSAKTKQKHQTFLPAGSQHEAYVRLRKIFQLATQEILIVDNYVDHTLWELLTNIKPNVKVRILTDHMKGDFRLEGRKFAAQYGKTVEVRKTSNYHDRFIIADGKRCWHVGASIKDAGSKAFVFSELVRTQVAKFVISDVAAQWSNAAVISL